MSQRVKRIEVQTEPQGEAAYLSQITEFDAAGNQTLLIDYHPDGTIETKTVSKFNTDNQLTEEIQFTDGEALSERKSFTRNQADKVTQIEIQYQDDSRAIQTIRFDETTKLETIEEIDEDGELEFREIHQYDDEKKLIARDVYDFNGKLKEAFTYSYDAEGNMIGRKQFDRRRKLELETEYQYNEKGLITFRANRTRKGQLSDFLKVDYDENGKVVKQNFSGKFFFVFEYDQQGNAVLEERYSAGNELEYQSRFEYDENNQLIKEISAEQTRELRYFYF